MEKLPYEIWVYILHCAKNVRCKEVCKDINAFYKENISNINNELYYEIINQKDFFDLPLHIIDKFLVDDIKFSESFMSCKIKYDTGPLFCHHYMTKTEKNIKSTITEYSEYIIRTPSISTSYCFNDKEKNLIEIPDTSRDYYYYDKQNEFIKNLLYQNYDNITLKYVDISLEESFVWLRYEDDKYKRYSLEFGVILCGCAFYNKYELFLKIVDKYKCHYNKLDKNIHEYILICFIKNDNYNAVKYTKKKTIIDVLNESICVNAIHVFDKFCESYSPNEIHKTHIINAIKFNNLYAFNELTKKIKLLDLINKKHSNKHNALEYICILSKNFCKFFMPFFEALLKNVNIFFNNNEFEYHGENKNELVLLRNFINQHKRSKFEKRIIKFINKEIKNCDKNLI